MIFKEDQRHKRLAEEAKKEAEHQESHATLAIAE
jgi:hypothetical protein